MLLFTLLFSMSVKAAPAQLPDMTKHMKGEDVRGAHLKDIVMAALRELGL